MYFSLITFNYKVFRQENHFGYPDLQWLHKSLSKAFPVPPSDQPHRTQTGLLYRIENLTKAQVLAQSTLYPQWELLGSDIHSYACKPVQPIAIEHLGIYNFKIVISPVYRLFTEKNTQKGKIVPITDLAHRMTWLHSLLSRNGFEILTVKGFPNHTEQIHKDTTSFFIPLAQFEGTVRIQDTACAIQALTQGIGKNRAYGAGFLTLAQLDA